MITIPHHGDEDHGSHSVYGLLCLLWWQHKPRYTSLLTLSFWQVLQLK